jgi:Flp pilus assembly protein TadD
MRPAGQPSRDLWLKLAITAIVLAILAPSPIPAPLISSVEQFAVAYTHGRPSAAVSSALDLIAFNPDFGEAYYWGAESAFRASQPALALQLLGAGRSRGTPAPGPICWEGDALAQTGEIEAALRAWEQVRDLCPQQALLLERLADGYDQLGRIAEAQGALEELADLRPEDLAVRRRLGLQMATDDPMKALGHLKYVLQNQTRPEEMLQQIVDLAQASDEEESRAFLLTQVGQILVRHNQWGLAVRALRNALAEEPNYPQALTLLGVAMINLGEDGGEPLEAAARLSPRDPVNHVFRSLGYLQNGEITAGIDELEVAAALDPKNPAILAQLGAAYAIQGDLAHALDNYLAAAEISDRGEQFWLLLAQFCNANQYEVAAVGLPAARNALSLGQRPGPALDAIGYAHFLSGNLPLAERFLTQALDADPFMPLAQYHLALLRLSQNQPEAARAALELTLRLNPDPSLAELAERSLTALSP